MRWVLLVLGILLILVALGIATSWLTTASGGPVVIIPTPVVTP